MSIKKFRIENKFTQFSLAKELGVSQSAVAKWENGVTVPRMNILQKLADLFGCTIDDLVRGGEKNDG